MKSLQTVVQGTVLTIALTITAAHASRGGSLNPDLIYGDDNRVEAYQVTNPAWQRIAASTAAIFRASSVRVSGSTARLNLRSLQQLMGVCSDEPFAHQGAGAFCSASLVAPDLVLTAGHCVSSSDPSLTIDDLCAGMAIVFDFAVRDSSGAAPTSVPASSVYGCSKVVAHAYDEATKNDFALIQLNRTVIDRDHLKVNRSGNVPEGTPLVLIGHPSGLPVKIADGAWVQDASNPVYLSANTDSYGGNSGSAVINATTGEVEGILVRGATDYVPNAQGTCMVSNRCDDTGCTNPNDMHLEEITRVNMATDFIP